MPEATFEVHITPRFAGVHPLWDVTVYKSIPAGVCGPAEEFTVDATFAALDAALATFQYERTSEFGPVCANGFATAQLTRTEGSHS